MSKLKTYVVRFLKGAAKKEAKQGFSRNAAALNVLVDAASNFPAESGCEANEGSRRRRQK